MFHSLNVKHVTSEMIFPGMLYGLVTDYRPVITWLVTFESF